MTEGTAARPLPVIAKSFTELVPAVESCDGEVCEIPEHREQLIMNRRVDEDRI